ncbi:acyl-CoA thioesterase [Sediminibacillus halophilus]|uniref:Acyl-CoA thioester hydrolase n=1 Tax=Sediminibacillus halophilus TaxID=482461 RepID=A0A1G9XLC4_9BACI|nr:thioesterase family protein [Sediminibacillus halophilus]SDM97216.1 acyl-CoA thioester hydrolase [Sediminibacillus halophilus]
MKAVNYIEDFDTWKESFSFFIPVNVRFSETDMFGHVNNVSPFIYFEEARIAFLKEVGLFRTDMEQADTIPIVADLQCDYHRQMYFNDQIKLFVKANHIGNTSIDIHYLGVNQKDEVCITGRGRLVQINVHTGKPAPFSEEERKRLTAEP